MNHELSQRQGELFKSQSAREAQSNQAGKRITDLESQLERLRDATKQASQAQAASSSFATPELVAKLEGTLRSSENEKNQLRENIVIEQKRITMMEQKYSSLFRELSLRDREITELKAAVNKLRKDHAARQGRDGDSPDGKKDLAQHLREVEERETGHKQEIKKLTFKLESQEKSFRVMHHDSSEKLKLLDQKLKEAKTKEVELLKRVEELTHNLKKFMKAA
jgi:chromosome segregation ATPase